jgi:hypothetical protein
MPKGTVKKGEYNRTTANLDKRIDNDLKMGKGIRDGYTDAVRNAKGLEKPAVAVAGAPYWAGAKLSETVSAKVGNYRSRKRNEYADGGKVKRKCK